MVMRLSFLIHHNRYVLQRVGLKFCKDCFEGTCFAAIDTESLLPRSLETMGKKEGLTECRC